MNNIKPGSYVWYNRKNSIVKVLEYDRQGDSYTIEYKGRVIDTTTEFIDTNIGSRCMKLQNDKVQLEKRIAELELLNKNLENKNKKLDQKNDENINDISNYISHLEKERNKLENIVENQKEKILEYRELYEKSIKSLLVKDDDSEKETIILNNFKNEKTDKFLWKDLNREHSPEINLYNLKDLKDWLSKSYEFPWEKASKEIKNWVLQEKEYIVGVYYSNNQSHHEKTLHIFKNIRNSPALDGGVINELVFYTNYGNITSIKYYNNSGFFRVKDVSVFRNNKILTSKLINIINKSISSGYITYENINSFKSGEELYDFINGVSKI